jgi:pyridoxamine 5'-phosphate oxidase
MNEFERLRKEYSSKSLFENEVAGDAILQFKKWWQEAIDSHIEEPNAMTLATATIDGKPSARIVLLKEINNKGFVFFTNYESRKGQQIQSNPNVSLVFFWKELERQVRVEGIIEKIATEESDAYFDSRPKESKIGAWSSPQSQILSGRGTLERDFLKYSEEFNSRNIPRPKHWGGYIVIPALIEFWQGRPARLHDRLQYTIQKDGNWKIERLAP